MPAPLFVLGLAASEIAMLAVGGVAVVVGTKYMYDSYADSEKVKDAEKRKMAAAEEALRIQKEVEAKVASGFREHMPSVQQFLDDKLNKHQMQLQQQLTNALLQLEQRAHAVAPAAKAA